MGINHFQELFLQSLNGSLAELLDLRLEALHCFYMDQSSIQDAFHYRAKHLGLQIATLLIDEKADLIQQRVQELLKLFNETPFILGPCREGDPLIYGHILNCLKRLAEDQKIWKAIQRFSAPLCHKGADELIKETLWPEQIRLVQTVHVRKAVLASWLTLLRQITGSCFATAPAILIQQTNPWLFLKDLYDLLSTGQLKRTLADKQYTVPLCSSAKEKSLQKTASNLTHSPGLALALEAVGIKMTNEIQEKIFELKDLSIEKILSLILMHVVGVSEEEIRDEEHLASIQMTLLLARQSAVYYQKPSERAQKVADWKRKLAIAGTTFRTMTECALLRSWEYSLASFTDVKIEFARWNLSIGLGLHPDQKGGIGAFLYQEIDQKLQKCNLEINQLSQEYEHAASTLRSIDLMLRSASSEARIYQLKSELSAHSLKVESILTMRKELIAKAEVLVGLFASLIEQYDKMLQESFQELFDPALSQEEEHPCDDSSAGFRLVYKHGRSDASQWTAIYSGAQYIEILREFFSSAENDLVGPKELLREITTALIQFIRRDEFLQSAILRSKEKGRKSPWDYISGGTLQTLLAVYYSREKSFTELKVIPRSPEELLHFLSKIKQQKEPLLIHSPTHAFIFYPHLFNLGKLGKNAFQWDEAMQEHLAHKLSERLSSEEKAPFIHFFRQKMSAKTNTQFRAHLIESLSIRIKNKESLVDTLLYEYYVILSTDQTKKLVNQILTELGRKELLSQLESSFFGSYQIYQIIKNLILQESHKALSAVDWDRKIAESMRRNGLLPSILIFADTNWSGWFFGFITNPATAQLELWRFNRNATQGIPMVDWKQWMDSQNTSSWILLSEPTEYSNL